MSQQENSGKERQLYYYDRLRYMLYLVWTLIGFVILVGFGRALHVSWGIILFPLCMMFCFVAMAPFFAYTKVSTEAVPEEERDEQ